VEVAVMVGDAFESLDEEHRLELFYGLAQELTSEADPDDYAAQVRLQKQLPFEEAERLSGIFRDARDAACKRALER
jgi:hypothetical protein